LDEGQHLSTKLGIREVTDERRQQFTSAGFLFKKTALILAKCEAIAICVFISSGDLSSTVSQNGPRIWSDELTQVSTIDHISLQRTSVATYGYLDIRIIKNRTPKLNENGKQNTHLNRPLSSPSICPVTYANNRCSTSTL
jgi:hypothetical protein